MDQFESIVEFVLRGTVRWGIGLVMGVIALMLLNWFVKFGLWLFGLVWMFFDEGWIDRDNR